MLCFHSPLSTSQDFQLKPLTLIILNFDMFDIKWKGHKEWERGKGNKWKWVIEKKKQCRVTWEVECSSKVFVYVCFPAEGVSSFVGGLLSSSFSPFLSPPSNPQDQSSLQGIPQICLYVRTTPSFSSFCCLFFLSFFLLYLLLHFIFNFSFPFSFFKYTVAPNNIWTCLDTYATLGWQNITPRLFSEVFCTYF